MSGRATRQVKQASLVTAVLGQSIAHAAGSPTLTGRKLRCIVTLDFGDHIVGGLRRRALSGWDGEYEREAIDADAGIAAMAAGWRRGGGGPCDRGVTP